MRFVAFTGPSLYYVGFGFDYNEYMRDLPHIGIASEEAKKRFHI